MIQLHGWLLRAGTSAAARKAVALWESLQQQGRLSDDIAEGLALAQLSLARLLLREVVSAELPELGKLGPPQGDAAGAKKATGGRTDRGKQDKERSKQRKQQGSTDGAAASAADETAEGSAVVTAAKSYAAAASSAEATSSSSASRARATAAAVSNSAPMPTACLSTLQECLHAKLGFQDQVQEAVRALADAHQTFVNCKQAAGAAEALSWLLAAKAAADITTADWQVRIRGDEGLSDAEKVIGQAKGAADVLQALATISNVVQGMLH